MYHYDVLYSTFSMPIKAAILLRGLLNKFKRDIVFEVQ